MHAVVGLNMKPYFKVFEWRLRCEIDWFGPFPPRFHKQYLRLVYLLAIPAEWRKWVCVMGPNQAQSLST